MKSLVLPGALLLAACDVPAPPSTSGGVPQLAEAGQGACGRGFSVVESDYQSVNVALLSLEGTVLTESLAASEVLAGGADVSLSGDVVLTSEPAVGAELPLLDRAASASRVLWLELATGRVARRVDVATGFPSNPHDFVAISSNKGYVARFGHNRDPGRQPFDAGDDLLIVNPSSGELLGTIDLRGALGDDSAAHLPRPDKLVVAGGSAYVLLGTLPLRGFTATVPSRIARLDPETDSIEDVLVLEGLRGCSSMVLAPSGAELAVLCSALVDSNGNSQQAFSGVGLVELAPAPRLKQTFRADAWGDAPVGSSGAYASASTLLLTTFGRFSATGEAEAQDSLLALDLATGRAERLLESEGVPFTLGGIACAANCGQCVVADAQREGGVVHHFGLTEEGGVLSHATVKVERRFGLPPRDVGRF
ncbi:MAG: hypothetical protein EOO73_13855 [Myxococcales bacterium]|nr:MAG: hypothetical protein EOO73_13855 [Myxococcales bacterium]